jgi:hypothetical protein
MSWKRQFIRLRGMCNTLGALSPRPQSRVHFLASGPEIKFEAYGAAAAAWTALRRFQGTDECICSLEQDENGLEAAIYY